MRIFVTGATGALGRHLVPGLVAAGHEVTATTRTPGKVAQLREAGAEPEVIVHQMTALAGMRSLRKPDKAFAATNELRTWGTDNLLAAAQRAGTRRVIAQSYAGAGPDQPSGGALKTEADPVGWRSIAGAVAMPAAITYVDTTVPGAVPEGIVLRYGTFYGPGASAAVLELVRKRRLPGWVGRLLAGEFVVAQMTTWRGSSNEKARKDLGWEPRYPSWRQGFRAWVG